MDNNKSFVVLCFVVLILAVLIMAWAWITGDGCILGDTCNKPIEATSRAIYATETYGAEQFHLQLTEIAK